MPEEGWQVSELEARGHGDHVEKHLYSLAERGGFPLVIPDFLPKTHRALALGEFARDRGPDAHDAMHHAIFAAYFADGRDIGSRDVLLDVADKQGFAHDEVELMWDEGRYDERLHQFLHIALHMGLDATPAALICDELHIGSRPYQVFRDAVDRCSGRIEAVPATDGAEPEAHRH